MGLRDASGATVGFFWCGELAGILTFGSFWRGEFADVPARRLAIHNFQKALTDRTALARRQAVTPPSRIVTPWQAACTLELCNPANMVINPTYLAQRTRSCTDYARHSH
jgi:hypothetical protein